MRPNKMLYSVLILISVGYATASNTRIIGGQPAAEGQFPHQVSLILDDQHFCGGSIITDRWILTAAHCLYINGYDDITIMAGSNRLDAPGEIYRAVNGTYHGHWDPDLLVNDIGLLKTDRIIETSDKIQTIALNSRSIPPGTKLTLSGWGYIQYPKEIQPNDLQYIELNYIDTEECKNRAYPNEIFDTELCTYNDFGEGSCKGDSGGPLILNDVLVGIVSWGRPCAVGKPDVFTDVASYLDWINGAIIND